MSENAEQRVDEGTDSEHPVVPASTLRVWRTRIGTSELLTMVFSSLPETRLKVKTRQMKIASSMVVRKLGSSRDYPPRPLNPAAGFASETNLAQHQGPHVGEFQSEFFNR